MKIQYKFLLLFSYLTGFGQTLTAQTYCLNYIFVKNTNTVDITLGMIASGSIFKLGSGNLQFKYKSDVLSSPTLVSDVLTPTGNYNGITITEPTSISLEGTGDALVSFNYNFAGASGNGYPISLSSSGTNLAVIRFQIRSNNLSPNIRPYDNGTMGTVVFDDNTSIPTFLSTTGNCPVYDPTVAIEWLELKAYATPGVEDKTVTIDWATVSEKNNSHFVVEHSIDGQTFYPIGSVKAANKASNYSFIDIRPIKSLNYYRIQQIDLDGKVSFSKIDSVLLKSSSKLKVYPTLTSDFLTVETEDTNDYSIINALGQQTLSGKSAKQVDVSILPQGTYIFKVGKEQVKFTKIAL